MHVIVQSSSVFYVLCSMYTVTSDVILSSYIELAMHRHNLRKRVGLWGSRPPLFGGYRPPTS